MDRVHRIGQKRDVRALRFIMKNSIEERFLSVQDAKQALGKGSLEKLKKNDRSKARVRDRQSLLVVDLTSYEYTIIYYLTYLLIDPFVRFSITLTSRCFTCFLQPFPYFCVCSSV
jgi:hypothetical protein